MQRERLEFRFVIRLVSFRRGAEIYNYTRQDVRVRPNLASIIMGTRSILNWKGRSDVCLIAGEENWRVSIVIVSIGLGLGLGLGLG